MAVKKAAWWQNPQTIVSMAVGLIAISTWVVNTIMADAKQAAKIEKTEEKVAEIDQEVTEHDGKIEQAQVQQQLIGRDLEYLKAQNASILEAIKQRR